MTMEVIEQKIEEINQRMDRVENKVEDLNTELRGTAKDPGAFETIRQTRKAVSDNTETMEKLLETMLTFKIERAKLLGAAAVVVALGSCMGWVLNHFIK